MNNALGERLRALRNQRAKGLKQAAPEIGVSYTFLSKLENGHVEPSEDTLRRLAAYYDVDEDTLGALAGRLPPDVVAYLQEDPDRVLALLRSHFGGSE